NGLTALTPRPRQDRGQTRAVAPETATLIERLKRENPHRTGAALLRELAPANEQDKAALSASTLYRFLRARGLTERQLLLDKAAAHKKYEAEHANQIWQSDLLFGPWVQRSGGGKMQVFLQATLDDASRLIPHAQSYPNPGLDSFLAALDPKALLSIEPLNERLWHWLDTVYHRHEHSALHTTPLLRWQRDVEQVRQLPPATDLRRLFFHRVDRLVRRDSTFLLRN